MSAASRIRNYIDNNPMKTYAATFISGDIILAFNTFAGASKLWLAGIGLGLLAHGIKLKYGRGALPQVRADDFTITLKNSFKHLEENAYSVGLALQPTALAATFIENMGEMGGAASRVTAKKIGEKFRQSADFRNYPFEAGWLLIGSAGAIYALDASNVLNLRENASVYQAAIGAGIVTGSATAFATNRMDITSRIFSACTLVGIVGGGLEQNPPLVLASLLFLYGAHMMGKVDARYQSDHTTSLQRPENPAP